MAFEFLADETLISTLNGKLGETVAIEVRATSAARSTTNGAWVGTGLVTEFTPMKGGVGDKNAVSLTVVSASDLQYLTTVTP